MCTKTMLPGKQRARVTESQDKRNLANNYKLKTDLSVEQTAIFSQLHLFINLETIPT